jgi:hypothetical protein
MHESWEENTIKKNSELKSTFREKTDRGISRILYQNNNVMTAAQVTAKQSVHSSRTKRPINTKYLELH